MPFKRAVVLLSSSGQRWLTAGRFQCPLSGQLCCCDSDGYRFPHRGVSMPFKRAVVLLYCGPPARGAVRGFNAL